MLRVLNAAAVSAGQGGQLLPEIPYSTVGATTAALTAWCTSHNRR